MLLAPPLQISGDWGRHKYTQYQWYSLISCTKTHEHNMYQSSIYKLSEHSVNKTKKIIVSI